MHGPHLCSRLREQPGRARFQAGTTFHRLQRNVRQAIRKIIYRRNTPMKSFRHCTAILGLTALTFGWPSLAADQTIARKLYVANTSGDTLSVIDLDRQAVVGEVRIGKHPHGLALWPDQRRSYCSVESERAVKFLETRTDQIVATVPTTGVPDQLAATSDGHWVYVAINDQGTADVIDVLQPKRVKTLEIGGR